MRIVIPLMALAFTTGAAAEVPAAPQAVPPEPVPGALAAQADPKAVCRDRIHEVRQERGLPMLQRDTAKPEEPLLIAAVDQRIDGCSVLVMKYGTTDVRPLPVAPGEPRLQRIPDQSRQ